MEMDNQKEYAVFGSIIHGIIMCIQETGVN